MFASLIRFIGRVMLAVMFVQGGWSAAHEPGGRVNAAESIGLPEPELAVRVNGWAMVIGGIALALGMFQRLAAFVLAVCLIPTTYAGHPYWKETDPQRRNQQRIHFFKNVSMLGGLLLLVAGEKQHKADGG